MAFLGFRDFSPIKLTLLTLLSGSTVCLYFTLRSMKKMLEDEDKEKEKNKKKRNMRCLITGFNDWRNLHKFEDIWRSNENPSSRLIIGCASNKPPVSKNGALVQYLNNNHPQIDWCFQTIPTIWSTSLSLDLVYFDVVIHLGLGNNSSHTLLLESGAYNERSSTVDASGHFPNEKMIDRNKTNPQTTIQMSFEKQQLIEKFEGFKLPNGFSVKIAHARKDNTYICNETYYRAVTAVNLTEEENQNHSNSTSSLKMAFFIHIPFPEKENDYGSLSEAVGSLVGQLMIESIKL